MSKGYFTFAQNSMEYLDEKIYVDYLRHAYGLALSIHATQKDITNISVAVTPGTIIHDKYKEVFDEIIEIPWGDMSENYDSKFYNEWKAGHISPYDETIKLEADMLFTSPIDHWWRYFEQHDMLFTCQVQDYRGKVITSRACREVFDSNNLPDLYNGFMYFKKDNATTLEFFKMAEVISKNYDEMAKEFLNYKRPIYLDTDTCYALAVDLIGKEKEFLRYDLQYPTFVHMKKELMDWELYYESFAWTRCVRYFFDANMQLYIANYKQTLPFHYHEKNFLTNDTIKMYERYLQL